MLVGVPAALGILAPVLGLQDPFDQNLPASLEPPSRAHPFGRDELGRDVLSRVVWGARISLVIGAVAVGIGMAGGVPLGLISGYYGGIVDMIVQRVIDTMLAFPGILLAIVLVATFGINLANAMVAVGIASIPAYARLVRGCTLALREKEFIEAARASGLSDGIIMARHILPNILSPLLVQSTLQFPSAILWAAGLGFLGLGAQPPTPEWGAMLSSARSYIRLAPHAVLFPGVAIMLVVLGFNLLGDALRDWLDPQLRGMGSR
jgi:ABC-type dipeptide/oligopeptide/nickel transport system permease subunit